MAQYPVALQVHIGVKDLAKAAGAKWNGTADTWEARNAAALYKCRRWAPPSQRLGLYWKREWLDVPLSVPFSRKEQAKAAGARFDKEHSCWYAPLGSATLSPDLNPYRMRFCVKHQE
jgi:putative DNA primase/helicase